MNKKAAAKLALRKVTLRRLSAGALATIQGGLPDEPMPTSTGSAYVCCARADKQL